MATRAPRLLALREATLADIAAIVEIEGAAFSDPWSEASFRSSISESGTVVTVAEMEGVLVGYSVAIFVDEDGELANLAVTPAARGKGAGTALLAEVIASAQRRGVRNLYLEVRQSNLQALSLYRNAGFTDLGQRRGYYSKPVENAVVMVRHFVQ